jgi:hypothetical protein
MAHKGPRDYLQESVSLQLDFANVESVLNKLEKLFATSKTSGGIFLSQWALCCRAIQTCKLIHKEFKPLITTIYTVFSSLA